MDERTPEVLVGQAHELYEITGRIGASKAVYNRPAVRPDPEELTEILPQWARKPVEIFIMSTVFVLLLFISARQIAILLHNSGH
jgi:hypothetical protein